MTNFFENKSSSQSPDISSQPDPVNPRSLLEAQKLLHLLTDLSSEKCHGVLSGQNAGHAIQFDDQTSMMGYYYNFQRINESTGYTPAILSIDYEHDHYTPAEYLSATNKELIAHASNGGVVTINWSPLSPWLNDGSNLANNRGSWQDARSAGSGGNANFIAINDLIDPLTPINSVWIRKLDHIADALDELNRANVAVLWRPLQEMNGNWFWWGMGSPEEYIALWQHMYEYFTQTRKLNNLLWVYSPAGFSTQPGTNTKGSMVNYPGDHVVDVIAPTSYSDDLLIKDYEHLGNIKKPLAVAEYGISLAQPELTEAAPTFEAKRYGERLKQDYPQVAYWVSWHSYYGNEEAIYKLSLADTKSPEKLFADDYVIALNNIKAKCNFL